MCCRLCEDPCSSGDECRGNGKSLFSHSSLYTLSYFDVRQETAKMTHNRSHPSHAHLRDAHEQIQSVAAIIHELLAEPEPADPVRLDLATGLLKRALSRLEPPKL